MARCGRPKVHRIPPRSKLNPTFWPLRFVYKVKVHGARIINTELSTNEWIKLCRAGERDASHTCRLTREERDDLVQECLLVALSIGTEWLRSYSGLGSRDTYLRRCIKHKAIDLLRTNRFTRQFIGSRQNDEPNIDFYDVHATTGLSEASWDISFDGSFCFNDLAAESRLSNYAEPD